MDWERRVPQASIFGPTFEAIIPTAKVEHFPIQLVVWGAFEMGEFGLMAVGAETWMCDL